jgi:NADP-dependent 3-hydroxy acid dehydrogenase YdfG
MKYEIPEMIRTGGGAIVNTSSGAGVVGYPLQPIYIASGLKNLDKSCSSKIF